jgi:predicted dehydrogenase/nucleoside-diphosphate-sugar epimerase
MKLAIPGGQVSAVHEMRFAIIGCGAVVEQSHVPALRSLRCRVTGLVDPSSQRRAVIQSALNMGSQESTHVDDLLASFDAAIVAVPHSLHEPICTQLLKAGKHVLVEKPMAISADACSAMMAAADAGQAKLAVALMRRQKKSFLWLKSALDAGAFGTLRRFTIREGMEYSWPLASDAMWRRSAAGGGVLIDGGSHVMDQIIWWFGEPDEIAYQDDCDGEGVEADCIVRLNWNSGLKGEIELSRTRKLSNQIVIEADHGRLELAIYGNTISGDATMLRYAAPRIGRPPFAPQTAGQLFAEQLRNFVTYVQGKPANIPSGGEAARSVALIEKCYAHRTYLDRTWLPRSLGGMPTPGADIADVAAALRGKSVLVVGASGFIGSRLVERLLLECGARPRVLLRGHARSARLARLGIDRFELVMGALDDPAVVERAVSGCVAVFNCAYDWFSVDANQSGIEALIRACIGNRAALIHLSTISIYEPLQDGALDEDSAFPAAGTSYGMAKRALDARIQQAVLDSGLRATILSPTVVYGPFGRAWTSTPAKRVRNGNVLLPENGEGLCNAVHVDDVCQAMIRAASIPHQNGSRYLVSADEPVSWAAFYGAYANALGRPAPQGIPRQTLEQRSKNPLWTFSLLLREPMRLLRVGVVHRFITGLSPQTMERLQRAYAAYRKVAPSSVFIPDGDELGFYSARCRVRIDRIRRDLGFRPRDLIVGMKDTAAWVQATFAEDA